MTNLEVSFNKTGARAPLLALLIFFSSIAFLDFSCSCLFDKTGACAPLLALFIFILSFFSLIVLLGFSCSFFSTRQAGTSLLALLYLLFSSPSSFLTAPRAHTHTCRGAGLGCLPSSAKAPPLLRLTPHSSRPNPPVPDVHPNNPCALLRTSLKLFTPHSPLLNPPPRCAAAAILQAATCWRVVLLSRRSMLWATTWASPTSSCLSLPCLSTWLSPPSQQRATTPSSSTAAATG